MFTQLIAGIQTLCELENKEWEKLMKKCKECGKEILEKAIICKYCGEVNGEITKPKIFKKIFVFLIVLAVIHLICLIISFFSGTHYFIIFESSILLELIERLIVLTIIIYSILKFNELNEKVRLILFNLLIYITITGSFFVIRQLFLTHVFLFYLILFSTNLPIFYLQVYIALKIHKYKDFFIN